MKIEDLKLSIIEVILNTEDEQLLRQVALLLRSQEKTVNMMREPMAVNGSPTAKDVYELSEEEEATVLEAREQYAQGRVFSDEQVREKNARWLRN